MSYDLMVFDTKVAPRERTAFLTWYKQLVKWTNSATMIALMAPVMNCKTGTAQS